MERLKCPGCDREFFLQTACSCCAPHPGPHLCPECGEVLYSMTPSYTFSGDWDEE
ncbi:MAG: hypothetical protein KAW93_02080 [Methanogenium sp.]|nr:hypothetical protein [Methanogenium sp.]